MKKALSALITVSVLSQSVPALTALPDVETYNQATKKYNFLLLESRSGCAYYTDPTFVTLNSRQKDVRQLIVLQTQSKNGGSLCSGVFQFQYADVNCSNNQIRLTDAVGSPATWKYERYSDPEMTKKVCALPIVEFGVPVQPTPTPASSPKPTVTPTPQPTKPPKPQATKPPKPQPKKSPTPRPTKAPTPQPAR
jgi:hypothetical protein